MLALGLYEETGSLAYPSTTPRDLEAAAVVLRAGADLNVVAEVLRHPLDPDLIALLNDLLQSGSIYYLEGRKILVASSTYDRYKGDLAEAVHRLAELQGFDAVIVAIAPVSYTHLDVYKRQASARCWCASPTATCST